jgi:phosphomannomutase
MAKEDKDAAAAAEAAFGKNSKPNDKVRFTFEGGAALKMRVSVKADALRFFAELGKRKAGALGAN